MTLILGPIQVGPCLEPRFDVGSPVSDRVPGVDETGPYSTYSPFAECVLVDAERPSRFVRQSNPVVSTNSWLAGVCVTGRLLRIISRRYVHHISVAKLDLVRTAVKRVSNIIPRFDDDADWRPRTGRGLFDFADRRTEDQLR